MIRIEPQFILVDSPIRIRIENLRPQQEVTVRLSRQAITVKRINELESHASFRANEKGVVDVSEQASLNGTYLGLEPMGLFWSLELKSTKENTREMPEGSLVAPQVFQLSVEHEGRVIEQTVLTRYWLAPKLTREKVRESDGLVGTYFWSKDETKPGIILFGGSEGGIAEQPAALLAAHGFHVLALGYWGIEDLPERLVSIPLEYVQKAIKWMEKRPEVKKGWLGVHGTSRGGELALLAASYFSEMKAAVSLNGSGVAFAGIVPWSEEPILPPAWTYEGRALPFANPKNPIPVAKECLRRFKNGENPLFDWYEALCADGQIVEHATISVERIQGDVLLISGQEDANFHTHALHHRAIDRLRKARHPFYYKHLTYPGAGHEIGIPYSRITANIFAGGTKQATAQASVDSWVHTIEFFKRSAAKI